MTGGGWPEEPSPRFIFNRMLRKDQLCPSPPECSYVLMEDPEAGPDALPCSECPLMLLEEYLVSPKGQLLSVIVDLDFVGQTRMEAWFEPIGYLEFQRLRQLTEERDKYQAEQMRKNSRS